MIKIIVTGGSGMVGRCLKDLVDDNKDEKQKWYFLSSKDCDLTNIDMIDKLFDKIKPKYVIHLANNTGGLYKNLKERVTMFRDNVRMNENILEICNKYDVQKAIFFLSSCMFPHNPSKFPMNELMVHQSEPHPSNEGFAYSKRMMELQCRNYNDQYGRQYICLIPVNLYGPYDNFSLTNSHVIPGLIHRFYKAKVNNENLIMYGTGKPLRQFVYCYDIAKITLRVLFNYNDTKSLICCNDEISIKDLTYLIATLSNCDTDRIKHDLTKSDGCQKKTVNGNLLKDIFPDFRYTALEDGLRQTIEWFNKNYDKCRK